MSQIRVGSVLRRRADVRFRVIDEEGVVVRQSAGEVLVLNEVATRILTLADSVASISCWIDALLGEFDVDRGQLTADVLAFAAELVEQGLLEPAAAESPPVPRQAGAAGGRG
jgi:hypothetical protein